MFIDTLRIISAERQIENAMDTALRSTMALFNEKLSGVGLFSYAGDAGTAKSDFDGFVKDQFLESGELSGVHNLANPEISNTSVSFENSRNLVDLDVFRHQVLESMKYQAPMQIGDQLFELISSGIKDKISEDEIDRIEKLQETYEDIITLAKERNRRIDKAVKEIEKYKELAQTKINKMIGNKSDYNYAGKTIPNYIGDMEGVIYYSERYLNLKKKEKKDLTSENKDEIKNFENEVKRLKKEHVNLFKQERGSLQEIIKQFVGTGKTASNPNKTSAMGINEQLREKINELDLDNMQVEDEEVRRELEMLKNLALEDEFFSEIITGIEEMEDDFKSTVGKRTDGEYVNYTIYQLVEAFYDKAAFKGDEEARDNAKDDLENRILYWINKKKPKHQDFIKDTLNGHLETYESSKKLLKDVNFKDEEEKSDGSFGDLWELLFSFENLANDQAEYDKLAEIMAHYDVASGNADLNQPSKSGFIKDAYNQMREFLKFLSDFPTSVRNELYINEYILANYGSNEPYELIGKSGDAYLYENKKAEFITYGYTTAGVNYFMFIKDVALLLFIVNLLENVLMRGGYLGPIGLLRAVTGAFIATANDIRKLTSGSQNYTLDWSPFRIKTNIKMTPKLFLRMYMLLKSNGETKNNEKLRRLQAVVTKETDVKLDEHPSYIEGKVEGKIKLWFIPALTRVLPNSSGNVSGNEYVIKKKKVYSY